MSLNVVIFSGGIGGSKLVQGFYLNESFESLIVIGNTGDDVEMHGLWISPDLDIVMYTLAELVDEMKGWGRSDETFDCMAAMGKLGEKTWFNLGDKDLAVHIIRTKMMREGKSLTEITRYFSKLLGIKADIIPATDQRVQTKILTPKGLMNFQEFYVRERCNPEIIKFFFEGEDSAKPSDEALSAIAHADILIFAPSNPIASIGPILAVRGIREAIAASRSKKIAVSPLVGGKSLKGPSDKMMLAAGYEPDAAGVADYYKGLIDAIVIDKEDRERSARLELDGLRVKVTDTIMNSKGDKKRLAEELIKFVI